ncbi:MAG: polysaccharide deacetylase 2 family uncharacterized protein YibQ [Paracoccaceae bacterium]|jgi:polysaccharide deacetylase 2 family uncharacterized protein YibQ
MRGFFGGLILGLIVVVGGIAALTLMNPIGRRPDVSATAPQSGDSATDGGAETGVAPAGTDADLVELAPTAPGADSAAPGDLSSLDAADTQPSDKPRVGDASGALSGPGEAPQTGSIAVGSDVPVSPGSATNAPDAPFAELQPSIASDPAQPSVPDISQTGSGFGATPPQEDASPVIASAADPARILGGQVAAVGEPGTETAPDPSTQTATAPTPDTTGSGVLVAPLTDSGSDPAAVPVPEVVATAPQVATLPQAGSDTEILRPTIGKPVVPLTQRNVQAVEATPEADVPTGPAIEVFAAEFENPEGRPMMAIVLIDDASAVGVEALQDFPYPLTFAVDPSAPDAAAKMARHRAAGFEVVALTDLPATATAQDAEVTLSVWLATLPEVVAVLEGTGSGIQGNRGLSGQVTDIASASGLGLITQANGLNTVQKLAARDGVPSAIVFRDFDGAGQKPAVMRRFLDQAAFRAGQQGGVIMLGRLRPDTISALLLWGLQDRASRVALAPVSAVLLNSLK